MGSQAPVSVPGGALSPNSLKRPHTIGLQVFLLFFYLNREPHLALSFSKVSEPLPLRRRGDLLETPRVSFWMTSREIAQEAHLLVPTCRAQSSRSGPAAEGHLAPSPASNYWAGRRVGLSSSPPRPPPAPAPPLSVSVVHGPVYSRLRHTVSPPLPSCQP